jgi:hypothetical protein
MICSQLVDRAGNRSFAMSTGVDRGSGDLDHIKDTFKATSAVTHGKTIAHMDDPSQQFDTETLTLLI